ncbi:MAG: universal stress protein [Xanthomonadales bacterium]|nr:universal stress protein [Xanthomonadales bacterium]
MSGTILLGIDGSEGGARALDFVKQWTQSCSGRIVVAYVIEWSPYSFNTPQENAERHRRREEELEQAQASVLEPVVAQLKAAGFEATGVIQHGHAAKTLVRIADEEQAHMIVVGRRGQSAMKTMLFGSVASTLVQLANVPVTVVP